MTTLNRPKTEEQPIKYHQTATEAALLHRLRARESQAFEEIHHTYCGRLHRTALKILNGSADAEDAVQDTLIRAFTKIDTFNGRSSLYTWLTSILVNCCLIQLRKHRRNPLQSLGTISDSGMAWTDILIAPQTSVETRMIDNERLNALRQAVLSLRPDFRFIMTARHDQELSMTEIARVLNLSLPAAKSKALRARHLCTLTAQRALQ